MVNDDARTIRVESIGSVCIVTMDRPPVHALDRVMASELAEVFGDISDRRDLNAVVLTASGDRAFCAGVDLDDSRRRYDPDKRAAGAARDQLDPGRVMRATFWAVRDCAVPVVAAVNGPAIGAGLCLASVADVIVASDNAHFGLTEVDVGALGGASFAQRLVGTHKARRMYFSGELVSAEELYRLGAVEAVVPRDRLMDEALGLATTFASKSPIGLRLAKTAFNRVEYLGLEEGYRLEQDYTEKLRTYEDAGEAGASRRERRPPLWRWH
jgi:enoyl-CoA hydratase